MAEQVSRPFVSRYGEVKPFVFPSEDHREVRIMMSPGRDGTATGVAIGVVDMPPGYSAPPHTHEIEQEAWYFFEGKGLIKIGDEVIDVEPGVVVAGPPRVPHQLINPGPGMLRAVFVFSPAGPEAPLIIK